MAATYLPIRALNRSTRIRIGGQTVLPNVTTYVDISQASVRKDLADHSTLGQIFVVGSISANNSDIDVEIGGLVTAGAGLTVNVASGEMRNASTGLYTNGAAGTNVALAAAHATLERTDLVSWSAAGAVVITQGTNAAVGTSVVPATPAGNCPLATVKVPPTATVPGTITDIRPRV